MKNTIERVAILDAGAQYAKVIDRRVRELCVESHIVPFSTPVDELLTRFSAVIVSGGPDSVNNPEAASYNPRLFTCGLPVLGICYGLQMLAKQFGGAVGQTDVREDGQFSINVNTASPLFHDLSPQQTVLLTHGDFVTTPPPQFRVVARTESGAIAAIADEASRLYGVQFHPEVDLTEHGHEMLRNFLQRICQFKCQFTVKSRLDDCIDEVRRVVGPKRTVLMLLSGGVDSTVCSALLGRALPKERLRFIHVDTGFMRQGESAQVVESLRALGIEVTLVDAAKEFSNATTTVHHPLPSRETAPLFELEDPEDKRRVIGDTFMSIVGDVTRRMGLTFDDCVLGQGTLRPDLIESASHLASVSNKADAIKTHHNDTYLVRQLRQQQRVVEPLKDFHKDEVRALGRELGLPEELVARHPFPGPGLAIRILCTSKPFFSNDYSRTVATLCQLFRLDMPIDGSISATKLNDLQLSESEKRLVERAASLKTPVYATLLPVKSVGVQGDARSYSHVVALTTDLPLISAELWSLLFELAKVIPKLCRDVNRVVFGWGPAVKRFRVVHAVTPTHLTSDVVGRLCEADVRATAVLRGANCMSKVAQMPVVLLPVDLEDVATATSEAPTSRHSVVLRPFVTHDFMTGVPAQPGRHLPLEVVDGMRRQVLSVDGICRVFYDLTAKPPATTEWE